VDILLSDLGDADQILELQKLCYQSEAALYDDFSIPPLTETIESMRDEFERQVILKAIDGPAIIGSVRARVEDETCHVGRLIVHPSFQNRGIGKELMLSVEAVFVSCRRFELFTGDRSTKNIAFYKNLGYQEYKREPLNEKVTLIYMEKRV
jgi:ribosomal protein S18 acetylase RimI-like enzyme